MNSKNSILLVDPDFEPNTADNCNLLIKITADSLSYAIIDKRSNEIKAVYDQQECSNTIQTLANKIKSDSYLMLPFKEIKISVYTENSIAVPNELFDTDNLNKYTNYFDDDQGLNLYIQPASSFGFTSIFTLSKFVDQTLTSSLAHGKLFDHTAPLHALAKEKNTALLLDFSATSFNVLYIKDEKLIFQNYYQIENSEELNYYILFIINQLKINATETEIHLIGIIHENDANHTCLAKYFKTISFCAADAKNDKILEDMPAHYYSSLLALDLCE
ncbi:DUF3822 family protein [Pedobacter frigoris]|uniref:DUF3822 family protein n=1 Tax=Pedobacter frigoris TaxID=2571272 RepID=A0A4V5NZ07_9SPHI|nr:DUF3822 family protein [Pedobacter frigoris]TKC06313.1 DUF3822 family protein [Pedobacter frigoris]